MRNHITPLKPTLSKTAEKTAAPLHRLLVQSRTPKKNFIFLLEIEEKVGRVQNQNRKQNFSLVGRAPKTAF